MNLLYDYPRVRCGRIGLQLSNRKDCEKSLKKPFHSDTKSSCLCAINSDSLSLHCLVFLLQCF